MKRCHHCGTPWEMEKKTPGVKECCGKCNAYLHCCKNCRFHNPAKHNQCEVPNADWVGDRIKANFCDHFEFKESDKTGTAGTSGDAAREALSQLFGGEEVPVKKPKSLDDLFGG